MTVRGRPRKESVYGPEWHGGESVNHKHCWHLVTTRGEQKVYTCCHLVQRDTQDRAKHEVCGAVFLPHPSMTLEVRSCGVLYRDELYEAARHLVIDTETLDAEAAAAAIVEAL